VGELPKAVHSSLRTLPNSMNWCRNEPTMATTWSLMRSASSLTPGNYCACLVEAVGIEPSSVHRVSHDSVAITRKGLDAETALEPIESELRDPLGIRVPNSRPADALLTHVRRAWGALRVV
jgi:hypothetical protein